MPRHDQARTPERFMSIQTLAERLEVSPRTVRRWITSGALRSYRLGGQIRIAEADLQAFLAARLEV